MSNFSLLSLSAHDLVLTPNQRLSNTLQQSLEKEHEKLSHSVFASINVYSFSSFIRLLWQSYIFIDPKKILTNDEEFLIWKKIIHESHISRTLLNTTKTISLAQRAWHHLIQWGFSENNLLSYIHDNENLQLFHTWAACFSTTCEREGWIDLSSALKSYTENSEFILNLPFQHIYFYHFIELSPLQQRFVDALREKNKKVTLIEPSPINKKISRYELNTSADELHAMAEWARKSYDSNKNAQIACVVPDLHIKREEILRVFSDVFCTDSPPIDISVGSLLSDFPIIQHMLSLFTLLEDKFDYDVFSHYLRSPYFHGAESDMAKRHKLDAMLRISCAKTTSLKKISAFFDGQDHNDVPLILNEKFVFHDSAALSHWCQQWLAYIKTLGWPGERNLNSTEYQVVKRFMTLLIEMEDFSTIQHHWSWLEFVSLLKILCQRTVFQAEKEKMSIQLLGLLEASGMSFDYLWLMGLNDKTLPSTPSPNPFLPYYLQKKHQFPQASAEREYLFSQELLKQLTASSQDVVLSHARYDADKECRPSPLITQIPLINFSQEKFFVGKNIQEACLEKFLDIQAPVVDDNELIRGGVSIVQQQALCPFKSFAYFRLHANTVSIPIDVPNALKRGQAVHHALDFFWNKVKTSRQLHHFSTIELDAHIEEAVLFAYEKCHIDNPFFASIEKIRLKQLLSEWLALEKKRGVFEVISTEKTQEYSYKNITLRMRIDRIDQVADNHYLVMDYKTGTPNPYDWLHPRMIEPQVPLYCLSYSDHVDTLCFGQVRWNEFALKGITSDDYVFDQIVAFEDISIEKRCSSWKEQHIFWKNSIDQLLEAFLQGDARVDPVNQTTCQYCDLPGLCRIFECKPYD